MRFCSDGPNIPDYLLDKRDKGRVVFLCGAGVSLNKGMPTFLELARQVINYFDPPIDSEVCLAFKPWKEVGRGPVSLDQIFHLLYLDYGKDEVSEIVAKILKVNKSNNAGSDEHEVISRISSDQKGRPQIVTTNFDRLFEEALDYNIEYHVPPSLPDINLGIPLTGVTYLHGRLQDAGSDHHSYILSSADFGRAYLSEAWATNFVRSLLKSFTVVLVGYQAEDPPVKYLLQGLNHDGKSDRKNLYAFDKGLPEEVEAKWRDRGVTAIPYSDHPQLWKSLSAWADRAKSPKKWRANIIKMALIGPAKLEPHERGQVMHLVSSKVGAREFCQSEISPSAEWLCVFDPICRGSGPAQSYVDDEVFDPVEYYGLDDDPSRPGDEGKIDFEGYRSALKWSKNDQDPNSDYRLSMFNPTLPKRLHYLSLWMASKVDSPILAWWLFKQNRVHPVLLERVGFEVKIKKNLPLKAVKTFNLILECFSDSRRYEWDEGWFDFIDRLKREGWTPGVVRSFQATTSPMLSFSSPYGVGTQKPPFSDWDGVDVNELANLKVKLPDRHAGEIEIPNEDLVPVFDSLEANLKRIVSFYSDVGVPFFKMPTCYPEREVEGDRRLGGEADSYFYWFLDLFDRVSDCFPEVARNKALLWDSGEPVFFRRLKLYAFNKEGLFEASDAGRVVAELTQDIFWCPDSRRELLFFITDRWKDFDDSLRRTIVNKIMEGPCNYGGWPEEEFANIKKSLVCMFLRWMQLQGCVFEREEEARLKILIAETKEWDDGRASRFLLEYNGFGGWVKTDEDVSLLEDVECEKIVEISIKESERDFHSLTEKRPFNGLVKTDPARALLALVIEGKKGNYPVFLWRALLNNWPSDVPPSLFRVYILRVCRLPSNVVVDMRHDVSRWIRENLSRLYDFDNDLAVNFYDCVVDVFFKDGEEASRSAIDSTSRNGKELASRKTVDHAINSPFGHLAMAMINLFSSRKGEEGNGIPDYIKSRLDKIIEAPGEGGAHVKCILCKRLGWLSYVDSRWARETVLPWFEIDNANENAEAAWNGYLSSPNLPPQWAGWKIKPSFIKLFSVYEDWGWGEHIKGVVAQLVVVLATFRKQHPDGLSPREARACLRQMSEQGRASAVRHLCAIGNANEDGWIKYVVPFVEGVWPKEKRFRTSFMSSAWMGLLGDSGDNFLDVFPVVLKNLVPINSNDYWLYRFHSKIDSDDSLVIKYPVQVLEMLNATIMDGADNLPYEIHEILEVIERSCPELSSDSRFFRLQELIENV